jgi:ABC-type bacteriocin/lantibiotic exporters, contain an N-terminal double-glycine peptidase domain
MRKFTLKKKSNKIRFLSIIFRHNSKIVIVAFLIMIVTATLDLLIPQITKKMLDEAIPKKNVNLLIQLIIIYIVISIINPFFEVVLEYIYSKVKKSVGSILKLKMLKHLSKLSGNYYTNLKTGNILSTIESDINVLESFGIDLIFTLIVDIGTALFALYFLIQMQWELLLIVILLQLVIIIVQMKFTNLISIKLSEFREKAGEISNIVQEYISNIMNVVISKSIFFFIKNYIKKEKEQVRRNIFFRYNIFK